MLRTRKKDINLKPNRILDKRSSRGMLYENEELRLRTIHINDEVDKGQNSIKKLKKENEHLKREIWTLRDECEKLEKMLKKVYKAIEESGGLEGLGLSPETRTALLQFPTYAAGQRRRSRRSLRRESGMTVDSLGDSEEDANSEEIQVRAGSDPLRENIMSQDTANEQNPSESSCPHRSTYSEMTSARLSNVENAGNMQSEVKDCIVNQETINQPPSPPLVPPVIEITPAAIFESNALTFKSCSVPEDTTTAPLGSKEFEFDWKISGSNTMLQRRSFYFGSKQQILKGMDISPFSKSMPDLRSCSQIASDTKQEYPPVQNEEVAEWDPNVLIGYIETGNGVSGKNNYKLSDFRIVELIDELDLELGCGGLCQVRSVRLMGSNGPMTLFVSFRSPSALKPLADKGIMELRNGDIRIRLLEAAKKWSLVHLFSLPPQIPDNHVIRVLNQYGQVVAPVQRSCYKGPSSASKASKGTPTTPPATEVNFYRSHSSGYDARRRSSASRFHLTSHMKEGLQNEYLPNDDDGVSRSCQQIKACGSRLERLSSKKHLPWFSCLGNGCL